MELAFSAIVPVYNVENYLEDCLDSIADQITPFNEVILINDGSTDNSKRICEDYCKRYEYFQLINQNNLGLSMARNKGIRISTGNYIVFIDSDDIIMSDMVLKLKAELNDSKYDVIFYDADVLLCGGQCHDSLNYFKRGSKFYGKDFKGLDYLMGSFPEKYIVSACMAVYKKQFILDNNIYFQNGIYFEDNDFCLRIYLLANKIKCLNEVLYIRRCHNDSITANRNTFKKCVDLIKVNLLIWSILNRSGVDIGFQIHLISYYFINSWRMIHESDYYAAVQKNWNKLLKEFYDSWLKIYLSNKLAFEDKLALMLFYSEWGEKYLPDMKYLKEQINNELIGKLRKMPLQDHNGIVGIYGIGNHTEKMLELYEKYVGDIPNDIFFIITQNIQGLTDFKGYPLTTCDNIPEKVDLIVISSLTYQEDMMEQLITVGIDENKIVKLYGEREFLDLSVVAEMLVVWEETRECI